MVIIASSRPAALDAEKPVKLGGILSTLRFVSSELQPMSLADSEAVVVQWHAAVARDLPDEANRQRLDAYERDVRQMLHDRVPIRHLASNPLLCAMICALNWDRRRRVPDDRMELYQAALDMLLEARDVDRGVGATHVEGLDRQAKEELLDIIAY
jgi:predicted NACHT family NTPase